MIRNRWIAAVALCAFVATAHATSIPSPAGQMVLWAENNSSSIGWHYDPATETLSTASEWQGPWLNVFPEQNRSSGIFATDVTAKYFVSAHVDHSGNVLGGTFAFLASSPTLGLNGIQPILAGTILGSTGANEYQPFDAHLLASVEYYNPLLAALTPTPDRALLTVHTCFCDDESMWPLWDHERSFGTVQPDIFAIQTIPEPQPYDLLTVGLAVAFLARRVWLATDRS